MIIWGQSFIWWPCVLNKVEVVLWHCLKIVDCARYKFCKACELILDRKLHVTSLGVKGIPAKSIQIIRIGLWKATNQAMSKVHIHSTVCSLENRIIWWEPSNSRIFSRLTRDEQNHIWAKSERNLVKSVEKFLLGSLSTVQWSHPSLYVSYEEKHHLWNIMIIAGSQKKFSMIVNNAPTLSLDSML